MGSQLTLIYFSSLFSSFQTFRCIMLHFFVPTRKSHGTSHCIVSHCLKCIEVLITHNCAGAPPRPVSVHVTCVLYDTKGNGANQQKLSSSFEHYIKVNQPFQLSTVTINAAVLRWVNATKSRSLGLWMADVMHSPSPIGNCLSNGIPIYMIAKQGSHKIWFIGSGEGFMVQHASGSYSYHNWL